MSKIMRAKFRVDSVTEHAYGNKEAALSAVCATNQENNQFAEATPSGQMKIMIDKEAVAKDFLQPGKEYYLDFQEAPENE